jgi:hypothetical protein
VSPVHPTGTRFLLPLVPPRRIERLPGQYRRSSLAAGSDEGQPLAGLVPRGGNLPSMSMESFSVPMVPQPGLGPCPPTWTASPTCRMAGTSSFPRRRGDMPRAALFSRSSLTAGFFLPVLRMQLDAVDRRLTRRRSGGGRLRRPVQRCDNAFFGRRLGDCLTGRRALCQAAGLEGTRCSRGPAGCGCGRGFLRRLSMWVAP